MKTLRAKIIALLVAAIMTVVGLATGLTFLMLELERPRFTQSTDANAALIAMILDHAGGPASPASLGAVGFQAQMAQGTPLHHMTKELRAALSRYHLPADVIVVRTPDSPWPVASIAIRARWIDAGPLGSQPVL